MRLIDADALIKVLKEWADTNAMRGYDTAYDVVQDCISTVENQPKAYDVEKVVAELEEHLLVVEIEDEHIIPESNVEEYFELNVIAMNDAIDIVRKGGVDHE